MKLSVQVRISLTQPSARSTVSTKIKTMKPILITLLCFTLLLLACEKTAMDPPHFKENVVQLSNLKAGQLSQFLRYTTNCNEMDANFEWSSDTLNLRVIEKDEQLYFEESLTPHSPMYLSGTFAAPISYPIASKNGKLFIPERENSALFFFYGNDHLQLEKSPSFFLNPLKQENCRMMLKGEVFVGDEIGIIDDFTVGPVNIKNKIAVSCVPVFVGVEAYLGYDPHQLYMSHVIRVDEFNGTRFEYVQGWYLLNEME